MLSPIQAFNCMNSAIQSSTGYSFSLSNIPKKINRADLLAIALVTKMYMSTANAEDLECFGRSFNGNCTDFCYSDIPEEFPHLVPICVRGCLRFC